MEIKEFKGWQSVPNDFKGLACYRWLVLLLRYYYGDGQYLSLGEIYSGAPSEFGYGFVGSGKYGDRLTKTEYWAKVYEKAKNHNAPEELLEYVLSQMLTSE